MNVGNHWANMFHANRVNILDKLKKELKRIVDQFREFIKLNKITKFVNFSSTAIALVRPAW